MKKHINNPKLISHILILALALSIAVVATFSWYNRSTSSAGEGNSFKYTQSGNINGEGGTVTTYAGTSDNGKITYSTEPLTLSSGALSAEPGSLNYFKTVIEDKSTVGAGDSLVSLYLENFTYSSSMEESIHIGIIQPEKTYKQYTATVSGDNCVIDSICLEDNIFIENNGTVEVYWFVEVDGSYDGTGSIDLGNLHLVYN